MKIRYVYYDKKTGFIKEILKKRKRGRAPYIECDFKDVEGFITGTKGIHQYVIAYDKSQDKNILRERNNIIRFRDVPKELYKIPMRSNIESDLTIAYYEDNVVEVTLDISRISPVAQTKFGKEILFERGTEFRIIMKSKDDDEVLKELIIDAQRLLEDGTMLFDVPNTGKDGPEFYTYRLLENYSWYRGFLKLMSPIKDKIKFHIHKADNVMRNDAFSYHLIGKRQENGIDFKNNIENLALIKYRDPIDFFLVDKHDPNILYQKFVLTDEHFNKKNFRVSLEVPTDGKTLLYNHKYISVLLEG